MQIIRYIVLFILFASVLHGLITSAWVLIKPYGNQKANICLGLLLFTFSLSTFNVLLLRTNVFGAYEHLYYAPLWYTLSFGPLFFYYIKFNIFPTYEARPSDLKHFILPAIQLSVIFLTTIQEETFKNQIWENFIQPIYGPIEYTLFLIFFFVYISLAYRYLRYKIVLLRTDGLLWEKQKAFSLRRVIRGLVILGTIYSFFAISDFIAYHGFGVNMYEVNGFGWLGDLAFAGMLTWLAISDYWEDLVAWISTRRSKSDDLLTVTQLDHWVTDDQRYKNPDLALVDVAKGLQTAPNTINKLLRRQLEYNFRNWLRVKRLTAVNEVFQNAEGKERDLFAIAWKMGFHSKAAFNRTFKRIMGRKPYRV